MKNTDTEIKLLHQLNCIYQTVLKLGAGMFRLAALELQLAQKSVVLICWLLLLLVMVSVSLWFSVNILLTVYLIAGGFSLSGALLIIIGVNVLAMLLLIRLFRKCCRNVSFAATRKQLTTSVEKTP